jgi:hypothetical protein
VHVVFEDHDPTILRVVHDKPHQPSEALWSSASRKLIHKSGSPANRPRPTGKVLAEIKKCIIRNRAEQMFAVDEPG